MNASVVFTFAVVEVGPRTWKVIKSCVSMDGIPSFRMCSGKFTTEYEAFQEVKALRARFGV